jgi:hypothetical protein
MAYSSAVAERSGDTALVATCNDFKSDGLTRTSGESIAVRGVNGLRFGKRCESWLKVPQIRPRELPEF